jgi:cell wall-associated NlpC family hydrolase
VYSLATNSNVLDGGSDAQMTMFGGVRTSAPVAGDLVFWVGHHVGVYIGSDQMINANHTGTYVEIDSVSGNSGEGAPVFVHYAG